MEASLTQAPPGRDYRAVFKRHIINRTGMVLGRVRRAEALLSPNLVKQALHILDYALGLSSAWPPSRDLLLALAPKMEQAGYRDEWLPYLERGLDSSQQAGDRRARAELHLQAGILYQLRTKYAEAQQHLQLSAATFERLNARRDQARALNRLAYVARLQRRFGEATALVETVQQLLAVEDGEWAFSYYVLGLVALDKREWSEAVDFSEKAFNLWAHPDRRRLMGRSLLCRGVALEKMGRYPEAMTICQQAVSLFEEIQDRFYQAIAQMNLGNVYFALEQPHEALELYLKAEGVFYQIGDTLHLGHVSNNIGVVYRHLQEWDKAKNAYSASVTFWWENGNIERLVNVMDGLGLSYFHAKQYHKAKTIFEEALGHLSKIEGEPGYEHWLQILMSHLDNASVKVAQDKNQTCL